MYVTLLKNKKGPQWGIKIFQQGQGCIDQRVEISPPANRTLVERIHCHKVD